MPDLQEWNDRQARARAGIDPARFLVGSWEGEGTSDGQPVHGRFEARAALGDTFVEAREQLTDSGGRMVHEDVSYYAFDVDEDHLAVLYLVAPGWTARHLVEPLFPGLRWHSGPLAPRVELRPEGDELSIRVWMPMEPEPSSSLRYRRT